MELGKLGLGGVVNTVFLLLSWTQHYRHDLQFTGQLVFLLQ